MILSVLVKTYETRDCLSLPFPSHPNPSLPFPSHSFLSHLFPLLLPCLILPFLPCPSLLFPSLFLPYSPLPSSSLAFSTFFAHLSTHLRGCRAWLPVAGAVLMTGGEGEGLKIFTEGRAADSRPLLLGKTKKIIYK